VFSRFLFLANETADERLPRPACSTHCEESPSLPRMWIFQS